MRVSAYVGGFACVSVNCVFLFRVGAFFCETGVRSILFVLLAE